MRAWLERTPFLVLAVAGLALMAALAVRDLAGEGPPPDDGSNVVTVDFGRKK